MIIHNIDTDIKVSAEYDDIGLDLESLCITVKVGNSKVNIACYDSGNSLIEGYDHLVQAFLVTKDLSNIEYSIRNHVSN